MSNFNSFLDSALETAKVVANAAGKKTEEVVETSKLRLQVLSINNELKQVYEKIGTMVYYAEKDHIDVQTAIADLIAEADQLQEQLGEAENRVAQLKKIKKCSNCGASCPADSHFCSRCGMIIDNDQPKEYYEAQPEQAEPMEAETENAAEPVVTEEAGQETAEETSCETAEETACENACECEEETAPTQE